MSHARTRPFNGLLVGAAAATVLLLLLGGMLYRLGNSGTTAAKGELFLYCAAGMQPAVEEIVAEYEREFGIPVRVQYGPSNTLLSQIEVARTGDLFLAADESYVEQGREKGLVDEVLPLATQQPVVAVKKGNPKNVRGIDDLLRSDVVVALANPDQAAIGKAARKLLQKSGHWDRLEAHVTKSGVFKPTVPEIANDVKIGSVDAAIVWDATVKQYPELEAVATPELEAGRSRIEIAVLRSTQQPTAALKFLRYAGAPDRGSKTLAAKGFEVVEGDVWQEKPEIVFFVGTVNRRAVEPVIAAFEQREGVRVLTNYNGCGILTANMRTINSSHKGVGFPDTYLACDVYYMRTVDDLFQEAVNVSQTEVVIAVAKGNPKGIKTVQDLAQPGMRVTVGQHEQCTIGVITKQLLEKEGLFDSVMNNVVMQTATSAMLVPGVITGNVDAALAYYTDTLAEKDKLEIIRIDSPAAQAIQPFGIARSSDHKHLSRRLYHAVSKAKPSFEAAGFRWRLDEKGNPMEIASPPAASEPASPATSTGETASEAPPTP